MGRDKATGTKRSRSTSGRRKPLRSAKVSLKVGRKDVFRSLEAYGAADGPGQRQGEIRDITTGKVLKSFTISEPILPGKASPPGSKKDVRKQNSGKRHVTRAATIREMRTQLGMSKKDIARAQQLLLDLKL